MDKKLKTILTVIAVFVSSLGLIGINAERSKWESEKDRQCGNYTLVLNEMIEYQLHFMYRESPHYTIEGVTFYPRFDANNMVVDLRHEGSIYTTTIKFDGQQTEAIEGASFKLRSFIWRGRIKVCVVYFFNQ